ncbi:MAG: hypothetical protein JO337_13125 [Acidimicrobiales bacterium]|nr:hypothetical protein [Acidimicrobiales bacterium]
MTGEEFLRDLADQIISETDVESWWERFSSAFAALDVVGAVDVETGRAIGEEIREDLARGSGQVIPGFHLGGRRAGGHPSRFRPPALAGPSWLNVRAARSVLPASVGTGGTNFVSQTDRDTWLVCSGAGPAPWPQHEMPRPAPGVSGPVALIRSADAPLPPPEVALFTDVIDDHGDRYRLLGGSSGASDSGGKRQRWDLRSVLGPPPGEDVSWLEFHTSGGPVRARLEPPVATAVSARKLEPASSTAEHYLADQLHDHVWLHLLDPERPLASLEVIAAALVSVNAIEASHPLVVAVETVDATIAGGPAGPTLPPVLAAALKAAPALGAWQQVAALGLIVDHPDGPSLGFEALVGHPDRLAAHFVSGSDRGSVGSHLVVTATDDLGDGYVAHREILGGIEEGAFHFRPPLHPDAGSLTISLQGPSSVIDIGIDLQR